MGFPESVEVGHSSCISGDDRSASRKAVGNAGLCRRGSRYGQADIEAAARLAASEVCAKRRREPAVRDRRLEKLAIEVLTALGERDATTIAATEQRAGAALQAMITDESLTV
jgi:hypothetical protein